jgi:O-antigen ligase
MPPQTSRSSPSNRPVLKPINARAFLVIWLLALYALSARLHLPGMGSIAQPATLIALAAGMWWAAARVVPQLGLDLGFQPVRTALFIYSGYLVLSFGVGSARPLTELEQSGSLRALITLVALVSVALLAADGIADLDELTRLLRFLPTIGSLFALYGFVQAVTGEAYLLSPPGLVWNLDGVPGLLERGGFIRPGATAMHAIEYSVVVASLLPLALHFSFYPSSTRDRLRAIAELAILVLAIPVSLSRTAVVCAVGGLLVLGSAWSWRRRLHVLVAGLLSLPILATVVPSLFGFMVELFVGARSDPSVTSRLDRVPRIMEVIRERPWLGWGHGTYSVEDFFLIDNQLWVTVISSGVVGLMITLALPLAAILAAAWPSSLLESDPSVRHMGRAIAASIAAFMISTATFTAFTYRILTFTLFLLIGCAGAFYRLTRDNP